MGVAALSKLISGPALITIVAYPFDQMNADCVLKQRLACTFFLLMLTGLLGACNASRGFIDGATSSGGVVLWIDEPLTQPTSRVTSPVTTLALSPSDRRWLALAIENTCGQPWSSQGRYPIRVSYAWFNDGKALPIEGHRTPLPVVVWPRETISLPVLIEAPPDRGRFVLRVSLVQEAITWFYRVGGGSLDIPTIVN